MQVQSRMLLGSYRHEDRRIQKDSRRRSIPFATLAPARNRKQLPPVDRLERL